MQTLSGNNMILPSAASAWRQAWAIIWRITVFFVLWGGLMAPAVLPQAWLHDLGQRSPAWLRFWFDGTGLLSALAACWVMVRWIDREVPLGFGRVDAMAGALRALAGGVAWLGVSLGLIALLGGVNFAPRGIFSGSGLSLAAASLLLNAALQEIIARSYLFQLVLRRSGPGWAVLVSSVIFTAMHAAAFQGAVLPMVNVFAASVLFGLVRLRTGSLWAVIALHFAWNFLTGPGLGLAVSGRDLADSWQLLSLGGPDWLTGGAFGIEGSAVVSVVTLAACGLVGWGKRVEGNALHLKT